MSFTPSLPGAHLATGGSSISALLGYPSLFGGGMGQGSGGGGYSQFGGLPPLGGGYNQGGGLPPLQLPPLGGGYSQGGGSFGQGGGGYGQGGGLYPPSYPPSQGYPPKQGYPPGGQGYSQLSCNADVSKRPFTFPVDILLPQAERNEKSHHRLNQGVVHADQGSDFNLISQSLVEDLGLLIANVPTNMNDGRVTMITADGRKSVLTQYVLFDMGVEGIWRQTKCFIVGSNSSESIKQSSQLLLGLPWLYEANATINIRASEILIGDLSKDEAVRKITGPGSKFSKSQSSLASHQSDASLTRCSIAVPILEAYTQPDDGYAYAAAQTLNEPSTPEEADAAAAQAKAQTKLEDVWHDFDISRFKTRDLPDYKYFNDRTTPPKGDTETPAPGKTGWVNLKQFIDLMAQDNVKPGGGPSRLTDKYFEMLRSWLPAPGLYPNGADALLGILLTAFFDTEASAQILSESSHSFTPRGSH